MAKLSDAELVIMKMLWSRNNLSALELAKKAKAEKGWEKTTVYTLIQRLIKKKAIARHDPGFVCEALTDARQVEREETQSFLDRMYNGSLNLMVKSFLTEEPVSKKELDELKRIIEQMEGE